MSKKIKISIDLELYKEDFVYFYQILQGSRLSTRIYRKKTGELLYNIYGDIINQLERKVLNSPEDIKEIAQFKSGMLAKAKMLSQNDMEEVYDNIIDKLSEQKSPGQ